MGNQFGLGLVLSFTDKASVGIGRVTNTIGQLEAAARNTSGVIDALGNSLSALSSIGSTFSALVTAPIAGFLGKIMNWGVQRASSIETLQISFETLMGTAKDASQYLDRVMGYAKTTPYAFDSLAQVAQSLISAGVDANTVLSKTSDGFGGLMNALGDWSGASSKGISGMTYVADTLGKISTLGKVDTIYIQSLERQGLQVSKMIGNLYGKSAIEAQKMIKSMDTKTFMRDLTRAIEEGTDGPNGTTPAMKGMVEKLKHTWEGAQDYFRSSLKNAGLALMGKYIDEDGKTHYKFLESMTEALNNISDSIKNISTVFQPMVDLVEKVMIKGSETIKKISEAFANLDEDSKKHISNIVMALTLLGPALILISRVGGLLMQTVGFFKTFATSMGGVTLLLTTLFFLMTTNFNKMGNSASEFISKFFGAVTGGLEELTKTAEDIKKTYNKLIDSNDFFDKLKLKVMQVVSFFKALADAWTDNTITEEMYDKLEALGILDFFSKVLIIKDRLTYFFKGFGEGLKEVYERVKAFIGMTPLGKIFESLINILSNGTREDFENFGNTLSKVLTTLLAFKTFGGFLLPVFTTLKDFGKGFLVGFAESMFDSESGIEAGIFSGGKSLFSTFIKGFTQEAKEKKISDLYREMFGGSTEDGNVFGEMFNNLFKEGSLTEDKIKELKSNIADAFFEDGANANDATSIADEFVDKVMGVLGSSDTVSKFDKISAVFQHPLKALGSVVGDIGTKIMSFLPKIGSLLTSPLGIIMMIVGAIILAYKHSEKFRQAVKDMIKVFSDLWEEIKPNLKAIWDSLKPALTAIKDALGYVFKALGDVLATILPPIVQIVSGLAKLIVGALQIITPILSFHFQLIGAIIKIVAAFLVPIIQIVADGIIGIANGIIDIVNGIKAAANFFGADFEYTKRIEYIKPTFDMGVFDSIGSSSSLGSDDSDNEITPIAPEGFSNNSDFGSLFDTSSSDAKSDSATPTVASTGDISNNITIYASTSEDEAGAKRVAKAMSALYRKMAVDLANRNGVKDTVTGKQQIDMFNATALAFEQASV